MLIPSIDLMGGKIVQLVRGEKKALEFDNSEPWVERFRKYPLIQLIDLDAAMGKGSNRELVRDFSAQLPCQVGGGIRDVDAARAVLEAGARKVIIGSALVRDGKVNAEFAQAVARELGVECLVFAIDSRGGKVSTHGWQQGTALTPQQVIMELDAYCSGFLYTHIDTEGTMTGFPMEVARELRDLTQRQMIAAGGIRSAEEIAELDAMGVDAVVGMAIYTGVIGV
ncbi:MAG TPA: 1-(5-phosphoribosyl)-5-[(5-phosphoribosylamino)methylideneamino] imidazole-4-carboxamide isomerase [Terriglobales bacterium]|nr:1-(5-phosphoribosyl)-5-[(5-phosphoribosylamino)methylideneamino] imidazole-4-carboxamide isomerase [Terriglobales bacterium]